MNVILEKLKNEFGEHRIKEHEPMSAHTTFKIGGPAEYYMDVDTQEGMIKAVTLAHKFNIPLFVFGGGSNIIVADSGISGLVVKNNCRKFEIAGISGRVTNQKAGVNFALVYAEGGVIMNQLVRFTIDQGLSGLEYQLGLPGTVGGGIYMNSNFPKEKVMVGDSLYQARILTKDGTIKEVERPYFQFAYDKSILQSTGEIVLSVIFKFDKFDTQTLWKRGMSALRHRSDSQPKGASAGCTFRNISVVDATQIPTPNGITSAGFLIDQAGLKGKRVGDAMISTVHANFILNMGNASATDITNLATLVKEEVHKKFKVQLHLEVKPVGFEKSEL